MSVRGPSNPYLAGPPIKGAYGFYGRSDIIDAVVNTFTRTMQNATVLHGQRRIGKSSLLHRLGRDETLAQKHVPIFFDMQQRQWATPARILAELAQTIVDNLALDLAVPDEASLIYDDHLFQWTFLPQIYPHLNGKRILFLFDEFEVVVPSDGTSLPGYFQTLIEEEREHLAFVFVVGQRLDFLVGEGLRRLFKVAQAEAVGRLREEDTRNLLTELGERGDIHYSEEALTEIWALTNGHPYITQLIGYEIFNRLQKQKTQQVALVDVENCLDGAFERGQTGLDWFWNGFNVEERLVLAAIAELTERHQGISDAKIDQILRQHSLFLNTPDREDAYRELLNGEFLIQADKRRYQFAVEFIRLWIAKYHPLREAQRQIEEGNPEAKNFYDLGRYASNKGNTTEAINFYRRALELNPYFSGPQLALVPALRTQGKIQAAIEEGEKAHLLDPDGARDLLIELHLEYAHTLLEEGHKLLADGNQKEGSAKQEEALSHARRVLDIDPTDAGARKFLSDIYLGYAEVHLEKFQFEAAQQAVQELVEPVPIIQDEAVNQRVRQLWLSYSQQLTQGENPQWTTAQQTLDTLGPWELMNEEVVTAYNEISLNKTRAFLEQDNLTLALDTLANELKTPQPNDQLKALLITYHQQQKEKLQWQQAEGTLIGLTRLVSDDDTKAALALLYHEWGDHLRLLNKFNEAIEIYRREGTKSEFKQKIKLAQQEQAEQYISNQLNQAQAAFEQKQLDIAFGHLENIQDKAIPRVKALVEASLPSWARQSEWVYGADALKRLANLYVDDSEIISWYVNWLYLWAQALFSGQGTVEAMTQAKELCQEILNIAPDNTPVLNLLDTLMIDEKTNIDLRRQTCLLVTEISLRQAQNCLDHNNLAEAQNLFQEALGLPIPMEGLGAKIQNTLQQFIREKVTKEEWEQARQTLAMLQKLNLYSHEIEQLSRHITINQARLQLKADQPAKASDVLNLLDIEAKNELSQVGKALLYEFSCLYAGRYRWTEAKQTVRILREWLPSEDQEQMIGLPNALNEEESESIDSELLVMQAEPVPDKQLELLQRKVKQVESSYEDAKRDNQPLTNWVDNRIKSSLALGQAYLNNNQLTKAMQTYQTILNLESLADVQRKRVNIQITQDLYVYSDRMLNQENWNEARQALDQLKSLDLPPREGKLQTYPDRRVDGAIQRIMLAQARAWLKQDKFEETFDLLQMLPRPWPDSAIKKVIRDESRERRDQNDWANVVIILRQLDEFLIADRDQVRDQEVLQWLVDGLEGHGQYLEAQGDLAQAAKVYYEGLIYTRQAAYPRNIDLAHQYIEVNLQLAQAQLDQDELTPEAPTVIKQALAYYQDILKLPELEHTVEHEARLNEALYQHAHKLAQAEQWPRAYQILDHLDSLYPTLKKPDDTLFATWRRELVLQEISAHLQNEQLTEAITKLNELKVWLNARNAPQASWLDSQAEVKKASYKFYENWLNQEAWAPAVQMMKALAQLYPSDREIIDWEVSALYQWGQWLQKQNDLLEAIVKYHEALAKGPQQKLVPVETIETELLKTQLAQAEKELELHNLAAAKETYQQILNKPVDHLNRGDKIRQALKRYSDSLAEQKPPQWAAAHQSLNTLLELDLNNEDVLEWRQTMTLREMEAMLQQDNLDSAFASLEALERPWPLEKTQAIVHLYSHERVKGDTWPLATKTLERLGINLLDDASARQWVVDELITLGNLLYDGEENFEGADAAYTLAHNFASG